MTLSIKVTQLNDTQHKHYAEVRYSECRILFIVMLLLNVIMLNVIMLNVIMRNVVSPPGQFWYEYQDENENGMTNTYHRSYD
jgi:hypothetical protein